jgi:hypothetical protein
MANETVFRDGINVTGIISGSGSINVSGNSEFGDLQTDTHQFTGSLDITGSGTLNGSPIITVADTASIISPTASYALYAESASVSDFATSASHALNADDAISASHALIADTADIALNVYISQSGQNADLGDITATSLSASNIIATTATIQTLYITETTRSVLYASGSTKFGDTQDDTHQFTGSVSISGSSLSIGGNEVITVADTGSMTVASASWADNVTSASHALNADDAISASHAVNADDAISSSFATQANSASWSDNAISSSHALNANTASFLLGTVESASYADFASTASHALNVYISQSGQDAELGTVSVTNLSASGWISASAMVSVNTLDVNGASYTTNQNVDVLIGTEVVDSFNSGGLCSAEWLACIKNVAGADYRTSKILAVWVQNIPLEILVIPMVLIWL